MNKDAFTKLEVKQIPSGEPYGMRFRAAMVATSEGLHRWHEDGVLEPELVKLIEHEVKRGLWHHLYGDISKAGQALLAEVGCLQVYPDNGRVHDSVKLAAIRFLDSFPTRP